MTIPIRILRSSTFIEYPEAVTFMEKYVDNILNKNVLGCLWFLEHPPTITGGTSAKKTDLLIPCDIPVYASGRGGQYTYHGPGQRVVYLMLDLKLFHKDVRFFVNQLETWLSNTLKKAGLDTKTYKDRIGIWVPNSKNYIESKIAAIGLRIKKWVCYHGIAINVSPNLNHFKTIVPCGIQELGVTSLENEDVDIKMSVLDELLIEEFCKLFEAQVTHDT